MQNNFKNSFFLLFSMHSMHWFSKDWEGLPFIGDCCQNIGKAATFSLGNSSSHHQKTGKKLPEKQKSKITFSVYKRVCPHPTPPAPHTHTHSLSHGFFTFTAVMQFESPHWNDKPCILLKSQPEKSRDGKCWSYVIAKCYPAFECGWR